MNQVNDSVVMLLDEARGAISDDGSMGKQLSALRSSIRDVMIKSNEITNNIRSAESMASNSLVDVDRAKKRSGGQSPHYRPRSSTSTPRDGRPYRRRRMH